MPGGRGGLILVKSEDGNEGDVGCNTYHDDSSTEYQIPQQVFLPVELGMCGLKLAQILENEVCVHDYA